MKQFYQMECEEYLQLLETKQAGLSQTEVLQRQERYGKNVLEEVKAKPIWQIFLAQFKDLLVIILIAAGIISMISRRSGKYNRYIVCDYLKCIIGNISKCESPKIIGCIKTAFYTSYTHYA